MREDRSTSAPAIVLTGERIDEAFRVNLDGQLSAIPLAGLHLLIQLILARAAAGTGHAKSPATPIWRLRKAFTKAVGSRRARTLIETGAGCEYRLSIPRADLKKQIGVTDAFFELVDLGVVSKQDAARLRRICHRIKAGIYEK